MHFIIMLYTTPQAASFKPWPNGLASQRKFATCVSFGHPLTWTCDDLRGLALTLVELKFGRKSTPFFTV